MKETVYSVKVNCSNCEMENQVIEIEKGTKRDEGIEKSKCPNCGCKTLTLKQVVREVIREITIYKDRYLPSYPTPIWYNNPFPTYTTTTCGGLTGKTFASSGANNVINMLTCKEEAV